MATVRAKFQVIRVERTIGSVYNKTTGKSDIKEVQTIILIPVVSGSEENESFYASTPYGEIKLGTVNAEAAAIFGLNTMVYVDFTLAEEIK